MSANVNIHQINQYPLTETKRCQPLTAWTRILKRLQKIENVSEIKLSGGPEKCAASVAVICSNHPPLKLSRGCSCHFSTVNRCSSPRYFSYSSFWHRSPMPPTHPASTSSSSPSTT